MASSDAEESAPQDPPPIAKRNMPRPYNPTVSPENLEDDNAEESEDPKTKSADDPGLEEYGGEEEDDSEDEEYNE